VTKPTLSNAELVDAVRYAALAHGKQRRKGNKIPYISHLFAVAALVLEAGGTPAQIQAAVLHDAAEDAGGQLRLDDIRRHFGDDVADIVGACSDSLASDPNAKEEWPERKERYLKHLRHADSEVLLVSLADKLHNATVTLRDLRRDGTKAFKKFNGRRKGTRWYYRELVAVFSKRRSELTPGGRELLRELRAVVKRIDAY
jgi:(p)ppGpp synthase/HD superfamily hydrolase